MTYTPGGKSGFALLEATLEAYGADRTRWPAHVRRDLSQFIGETGEARKLISQAQALDRLLDMAPAFSEERRSELAEQIVYAAAHSPRILAAPVRRRFMPSMGTGGSALAGVALAASLVLGVLVGSNPTYAPALQNIATTVGLDSGTSGDQVAAGEDADGIVSEDLL